MTYQYSRRSKERLQSCHFVLQALMTEAIKGAPSDMSIVSGYRGEAQQNELYKNRRSKVQWPNSKHNKDPSEAVDVVPYVGGLSWNWAHIEPLAEHIKAAWTRLPAHVTEGWRLEWGGDWRWRDGAHWQIVREE